MTQPPVRAPPRARSEEHSLDIPLVKVNSAQVLGIAAFGVAAGIWLKRRLPVLDRLNIPASVVGGLFYALVILGLRDRVVNFELDVTLRDLFMVAFFTTIGMSASLRVVRQGGKQVLVFFGLATLGVLLENVTGVLTALALGLDPLLGLLVGSVSMAGGPATALAFGETFESLGLQGATSLGVAAAIFGIVAGGLLGGYAGGFLIRRDRLTPEAAGGGSRLEEVAYRPEEGAEPLRFAEEHEEERSPLLTNALAIAIAMGLGTLVSAALQSAGLLLPSYIGAMMCAAVLRNLDDRFGLIGIAQRQMDQIGNVSLDLFIVMALLTLRLWEMLALALPVLLMLGVQVLLVLALSRWLVYRVMRRDFDAAVVSGGFCGFMLGTTANAMACMNELANRYGPAPRAFLVVSLVGAFLIDFTNALIITQFLNLFR
ncbi:MAG: sodium/glutamate symporter [Solibacteraceae bacterium]|nr:sodium/glutamate symporter [Solibacteraceae bacterium]